MKTYLARNAVKIGIQPISQNYSPRVRVFEIGFGRSEVIVDVVIWEKSAEHEIALIVPKHPQDSAPRAVPVGLSAVHVGAKRAYLQGIDSSSVFN